jgi:hypothetical protein
LIQLLYKCSSGQLFEMNLKMPIWTAIVCLALEPMATFSALPPGYEDEIYCPRTMCLRRKIPTHKKITRPRTMFVECFNPETKEICRPRAWGDKLEIEYRKSLILDNWHMDKCDENETSKKSDILLDYMLLGSRFDSIIEKLAIISFL